jgi:hypothetical protein
MIPAALDAAAMDRIIAAMGFEPAYRRHASVFEFLSGFLDGVSTRRGTLRYPIAPIERNAGAALR